MAYSTSVTAPSQRLVVFLIAVLASTGISATLIAQNIDWPGLAVSDTVTAPNGVVTADIDGDGDMDVIAAAEGFDTISWIENVDGAGTAWAKHQIAKDFVGPVDIAAGDLDNDGDVDIAAISPSLDELAVWLNLDGVGTTWSAQNTLAPSFADASSIEMVDINLDGNLDIVGTAAGANELVWFDNSLGNGIDFTAFVVSETVDQARSPTAADLDNDGDIDLAAVSEENHAFVWFENLNGAGTSWDKHLVSMGLEGARDVTTGDLDGDGDIDLAGTLMHLNRLYWWENVGPGETWVQHFIVAGLAAANAVEVADIDGDDHPDITVSGSGTVFVYRNIAGDGSDWSLHKPTDDVLGVNSIALADIDGDEDLDIVTARVSPDEIQWWDNTPTLNAFGACPANVTIQVRQAGPSHEYAIAFSDNSGETQVPPGSPCAGTLLSLESARVATFGTTDPSGAEVLRPSLPAERCGSLMQLIDIVTCEVSNVDLLGIAD